MRCFRVGDTVKQVSSFHEERIGRIGTVTKIYGHFDMSVKFFEEDRERMVAKSRVELVSGNRITRNPVNSPEDL